MILASFYAPRPEHPRHRYTFEALLDLQFASCRCLGVRQVVISDTDRLSVDGDIFVATLPHALMPAIIAGQLALLDSNPDDDLLLTGADCLLGADPRPLFDGSFDLAVTTHRFDDCILNTGLIVVPRGQARAAAPIWRRALARCGERWGDDQQALAREIRPTLKHGVEDRDGLRVRFLPVPGFNDAPDNARDGIRPVIVHFRGPRKAFMAEWSARFLDA